jgi:Arc/MetJ-type ribon-helix-helix transcriptional regulator
MNDKKDNKVTIKIPRPLYNNLKFLIEDSGFNSVNDFIVYILRDIASNTKIDSEDQLSKEEIETIKERLRNLGYLG